MVGSCRHSRGWAEVVERTSLSVTRDNDPILLDLIFWVIAGSIRLPMLVGYVCRIDIPVPRSW